MHGRYKLYRSIAVTLLQKIKEKRGKKDKKRRVALSRCLFVSLYIFFSVVLFFSFFVFNPTGHVNWNTRISQGGRTAELWIYIDVRLARSVHVRTRGRADHRRNRSTDRATAATNQTSSKPWNLCAGNPWKFHDSSRLHLCAATDPRIRRTPSQLAAIAAFPRVSTLAVSASVSASRNKNRRTPQNLVAAKIVVLYQTKCWMIKYLESSIFVP